MRVPLTRTGQSAVDWFRGSIVEDIDVQKPEHLEGGGWGSVRTASAVINTGDELHIFHYIELRRQFLGGPS